MHLHRSLLAAALVLLAGNLAAGQSFLDKVEKTLRSKLAPAAAPAEAGAAQPTPYLGFVPNETIDDGKGVRVDSVTPGGPAETGGLRAGDLITAIDGKAVKNLTDFDAIYNTATVGQKLRVTVERAAKLQSLTITLGTRPAAAAAAVGDEPGEAPPPEPGLTDPASKPGVDPGAPADPATPPRAIRSKPLDANPLDLGSPPADPADADPAIPAPRSVLNPATEPPTSTPLDSLPAPAETTGRPSLGITVVPLTEEARAAYGLTVRRGALITNVRPGSPADTAGLPVGGVVVAIDGRRIDTADDLVGSIRASRVGQEVELTYYEGDRLARKDVRLAPAAAGIVAAPPADADPLRAPADDPKLGLRLGGAGRPLLDKVERAIDGFAAPRGPSTVYNPAEMAELHDKIAEMQEKITSLEERVKLLEAKLGDAPPAANPVGGGLGEGAAPPAANPLFPPASP